MSKQSPDTAAQLEAWFLGDRESAVDVTDVAGAVRDSEEFERRFDELAMADRLLAGDADNPGEFERDFGRALFESGLDALLAEEGEDDADQHVAPVIQLRPQRPIAAYASAAAVLLLGIVATIQADRLSSVAPDAFQARTAAVAGLEPRADAPRLMAFCVERSGGEVAFTGPEQAPFGVVSCPNDAEMKLAVENSESTWKWAAFFGVHEDGTLLWYGPSPAATRPIAIATGDEVQPVGETIRLSVNHKPGAVRVHALFTREPVDFAQLQRWVDGNKSALFDHTLVVEPAVGETDTQLFEVKP